MAVKPVYGYATIALVLNSRQLDLVKSQTCAELAPIVGNITPARADAVASCGSPAPSGGPVPAPTLRGAARPLTSASSQHVDPPEVAREVTGGQNGDDASSAPTHRKDELSGVLK